MKKITAIFCILMVALSMTATEPFRPSRFTSRLGKIELQPNVTKTIARSPQAEMALKDVKISTFEVNTDYLASMGLIIYALVDESNTQIFVYTINITSKLSDVELGKTYGWSDMYAQNCYIYTSSGYTDYTSATFKKSQLADGRIRIDATVAIGTGRRATNYTLTYEEEEILPPTGDTIDVFITDAVEGQPYSSGDWQFIGQNKDYTVSVDIFTGDMTKPAAGSYSSAKDEFDLAYTYLYDADKKRINIASAEATLTAAEKGMGIVANLLGKNGIVYHVTMYYDMSVLPYDETEKDFNVAFTSSSYSKSQNMFSIVAQNDTAYISLAMYVEGDKIAVGEYPINASEKAPSVLASAGLDTLGYIQPSFAGYIGTEGISNAWFLVDGKVTVAADGSITVDAVNSAGKTVKSTIAAPEPARLKYDTDEDVSMVINEYEVDTTYFAKYGEIIVQAMTDTTGVALIFATLSNELAAGEYPINESYEAPSVNASLGYSEEYGDIPSYAMTIAGEKIDKTWYMVGGKVTVNADKSIDIAAVNSYERKIAIKLIAPKETPATEPTDPENPDKPDDPENPDESNENIEFESELNPTKHIVNGHILIKINGRTYDMLGNRLD